MIVFDSKSIQNTITKIKKEYSDVSGDVLNQAISRALNRTAQMSKTSANKEIRENYNISASALNNELKTRYANKRHQESAVIASGAPLSLNNFQAKQIGDRATTSFDRRGRASSRLNRKSRNNAAKGVTAVIKKGQTINLPTAFIQVANGGITVFARGKYKGTSQGFEFAKPRLPIGKITTTSVPLMFANKDVINPVTRAAEVNLIDRIEHEITWLLRK